VVVGVSTNDGLGASCENMARLYQRKHYYFVPYGQDDPTNKTNSLKADFARLPAALDAALAGRQLHPVLLGNHDAEFVKYTHEKTSRRNLSGFSCVIFLRIFQES